MIGRLAGWLADWLPDPPEGEGKGAVTVRFDDDIQSTSRQRQQHAKSLQQPAATVALPNSNSAGLLSCRSPTRRRLLLMRRLAWDCTHHSLLTCL